MASVISVLIPTYNRPNGLIRAVDSALTQSYKDIEIVVTDNSDSDSSYNILKTRLSQYNNIIYHKNIENIGPILNWRKALDLATGKYCIILPDDDYLLNPFYFSDAIKLFEQYDTKLIFTSCVYGRNIGKNAIGGRRKSELISGIKFIEGFWRQYNIFTIANIFERNLALKISPFKKNEVLYSDIAFWLKALSMSNVYFYNIPSVYYFFHSQNIVTNMSRKKLVDNSKFITDVVNFYRNTELDKKNDLVDLKMNLIYRYILFTMGLYKFFSFSYCKQIISSNASNGIEFSFKRLLKIYFISLYRRFKWWFFNFMSFLR